MEPQYTDDRRLFFPGLHIQKEALKYMVFPEPITLMHLSCLHFVKIQETLK